MSKNSNLITEEEKKELDSISEWLGLDEKEYERMKKKFLEFKNNHEDVGREKLNEMLMSEILDRVIEELNEVDKNNIESEENSKVINLLDK